jgi:hypothetical protein
MPFLIVLLALIAPRVVLLLLWFLTAWPHYLFHTLLWPLLGLILMPTTLLVYMVVEHWFGGHWTLWPAVTIIVAVLIDLAPAGGRSWSRL